MKKSELRQIIREELQALNEGSSLYKGRYVDVYKNGVKDVLKFVDDGYKSSKPIKKKTTLFVKSLKTGKPIKMFADMEFDNARNWHSFDIKAEGDKYGATMFGDMPAPPGYKQPKPSTPESTKKALIKFIANYFVKEV